MSPPLPAARTLGLAAIAVSAALVSPAAQAASASLGLEVSELQVGDSAPLELDIVDGDVRTPPTIPSSDEVRITYQGRTQSFLSVNLRTTRTVTYQYAVTALTPGTAVIGPVGVTVGGQAVSAPGVQLRVVDRVTAPRKDNLVDAELLPEGSADALWVGQTVVYHFTFRHKDSLVDARWSAPEPQGLVSETTAQQSQREVRLNERGQNVTLHEIDLPLVVGAPGRGTIPPGLITAQFAVASRRQRSRNGFESIFDQNFGMFTETRSETLAAEPIPFVARALPTEDRPDSFTGLVGSFVLDSFVSNRALAVGDSTTLTVKLTGDGTLAGFALPPAPGGTGFRFYDDTPTITGEVKGGAFLASAELKRAVVPLAAGSQVLPGFSISWFDPRLGRYVTETLPDVPIEVAPGEEPPSAITSFATATGAHKEEVASLGEDILPIHASARLRPRGDLWGPALIAGLPGLAWVGLVIRDRASPMSRRAARVRALKRRLARLPQEPRAALGELEACFREAAALALGCAPAGVDEGRLATLPASDRDAALALYQRLAAARYRGAAALEEGLADEVRRLVGRLL